MLTSSPSTTSPEAQPQARTWHFSGGEECIMAIPPLVRRVDTLENRVDSTTKEIRAFRGDVAAEFANVRQEFAQFRAEVAAEFTQVRVSIEETNRHMRVLHEDVIGRIALLQEAIERPKRNGRRRK